MIDDRPSKDKLLLKYEIIFYCNIPLFFQKKKQKGGMMDDRIRWISISLKKKLKEEEDIIAVKIGVYPRVLDPPVFFLVRL